MGSLTSHIELINMERICETGPTVYSLYPRRLFNPRRLLPETKTYDPTASDFLFADDCALNASSHQDMQVSKDLFASACTDFGLAISAKKTEVLLTCDQASLLFLSGRERNA